MKPEPTMPSRRIWRGAAVPGADPVVFLERRRRKEDLHQLARDIAHRELAEGAMLFRQPRRDALLQADPHRLERGERRRIVAAGLLQHLLPRAAIDQPPSRTGVDRATCRPAPPLRLTLGKALPGQPVRGGDGDLAENAGAAPARRPGPAEAPWPARSVLPVRIMSSAARTPISRGSRWHPPAPGMSPSCTSGRPSCGLGMIGGDPVVAGQRQLEPTAEAGAVDGGDDRLLGGLDPADRSPGPRSSAARLRILAGRCAVNSSISAPGDEVVGLAGDEHHRPDRGILAQARQQRLELDADRGVELVDRLARQVEGEDGDAVVVGRVKADIVESPVASR